MVGTVLMHFMVQVQVLSCVILAQYIYLSFAGAIALMAKEVGYEIIHAANFLDLFLVQKDLLEGICPPPLSAFSNRVLNFHPCVEDLNRKGKWMEYATYSALVREHSANYEDVYNCSDQNIIEIAQRAATEQYLLMHKGTDMYAASASCLGFL